MNLDQEKLELGYLKKLLSGREIKSVIEIGCGEGRITEMLNEILDADITAIDADEESLAKAKEKLPDVYFKKSTFTDFFSDDKFDLMVFSMSAHHLVNFEYQYVKIERFLNEGGYVLFVEPSEASQVTKLVLLNDPEEEDRIKKTSEIIKNLPWTKIAEGQLQLKWQFDNVEELSSEILDGKDYFDEVLRILNLDKDQEINILDEVNYNLLKIV